MFEEQCQIAPKEILKQSTEKAEISELKRVGQSCCLKVIAFVLHYFIIYELLFKLHYYWSNKFLNCLGKKVYSSARTYLRHYKSPFTPQKHKVYCNSILIIYDLLPQTPRSIQLIRVIILAPIKKSTRKIVLFFYFTLIYFVL